MHKTRLARVCGFTLIELLVVIAIIAILIAKILPPDPSVRQDLAKNFGTASLASPLCSPPWCDSLGKGTTLYYPTIPPGLDADMALSKGIYVTYDGALLDSGMPFAVFANDTPGLTDPIHVAFDFDPSLLGNADFLLKGVTYTDRGTVRFDVGLPGGGERILEASASDGGITIAPPTVPEPSTILLLGVALAGLGIMRRRQQRMD